MLCIELLPAGKIVKPTKSLTAKWYYMMYHKANHDKFVTSRKKFSNETIVSLTEYFHAHFAQKWRWTISTAMQGSG